MTARIQFCIIWKLRKNLLSFLSVTYCSALTAISWTCIPFSGEKLFCRRVRDETRSIWFIEVYVARALPLRTLLPLSSVRLWTWIWDRSRFCQGSACLVCTLMTSRPDAEHYLNIRRALETKGLQMSKYKHRRLWQNICKLFCRGVGASLPFSSNGGVEDPAVDQAPSSASPRSSCSTAKTSTHEFGASSEIAVKFESSQIAAQELSKRLQNLSMDPESVRTTTSPPCIVDDIAAMHCRRQRGPATSVSLQSIAALHGATFWAMTSTSTLSMHRRDAIYHRYVAGDESVASVKNIYVQADKVYVSSYCSGGYDWIFEMDLNNHMFHVPSKDPCWRLSVRCTYQVPAIVQPSRSSVYRRELIGPAVWPFNSGVSLIKISRRNGC